MNIEIPSQLSPVHSINFANFISQLEEYPTYIYDFHKMQHCRPYGLLVIASAIRNNMNCYPRASHSAINYNSTQGCEFASTFGFFQSSGFDIGDLKEENDTGYRFVPIKTISSDYLNYEYTDTTLLNEKVNYQAVFLADTLVGDQPKNVQEVVQYCFREMMRNVFEHAQIKELWVCGQYWPSRNEAEIAILDEGIGILKSLKTNARIHAESCSEANRLALQPGLSRTIGMKQNPYDQWQNSGYGLYVASTLCAINGGYFILSSGDKTIFVNGQQQTEYSTNQLGTAICLTIQTKSKKLRNFDETLEEIVREGENRAQENGEKRILTASKVTTIASMIKHIETNSHQDLCHVSDCLLVENHIAINTEVLFTANSFNQKGELLGKFIYDEKEYSGVLLHVSSKSRIFYINNQIPIHAIVRKRRNDTYVLLEKHKYDKQVKKNKPKC